MAFQERGFLCFLVNELELKICLRGQHLRGLQRGGSLDTQLLHTKINSAYPHDLYLGEQELPLLAGQGVLRVGGGGDREFPSAAASLLLFELDPLDVPVVDRV